MSTLTGVNADAVRPALRQMEKQVQELSGEISKYCLGDEIEISHLTITTTSANRFFYTPEQLKSKCEELETLKLKVCKEKEPREKKIEEIRAKILLVTHLKTQSLQDMTAITGSPTPVVSIMDQYLEQGLTLKDFEGIPIYI